MFYINIRMTTLLKHIKMLGELKNSIDAMNDLLQDETNNCPSGWLLQDYTRIRDDLIKLYEYKRNIFTKKNMKHFMEFRCDRDEIRSIVINEEVRSKLFCAVENYPLQYYEDILLELIELDQELKETLLKNDPELLKKLNKK
jgi:hypothetical protein